MASSWNVLKPSGEDVFQIEPGMPGFDYGLPTVFFNASSTAGTTFFSNIPTLGAGGEFKVAYVVRGDGAPVFSVDVPSSNGVNLAKLESGKIATVKVVRDCDTWYCTQDCFEVTVEDFDESVLDAPVAEEKPCCDASCDAPIEEKPCCDASCDAPVDSECPCSPCLCITVVKADGTTVDLCATSVSIKGKGINVSLSA